MLTARSQAADIAEGRRVGADAYVIKPYESETLVEQVALLLARAESGKPWKGRRNEHDA